MNNILRTLFSVVLKAGRLALNIMEAAPDNSKLFMVSPGKIVYHLYYRPLGLISKILQTGIKRSWQQEQGRKVMVKAAYDLKEIQYSGEEAFDIYFLTGRKYWYQTAFCLYSLQKQSLKNIHAFIIDDGTFDDKLETQVKIQFPSAVIIRRETVNQLLNEHLPEDIYPVLRKRRLEYPHLRKLTDIHVIPSIKPKLVLDSDMLFFKRPDAVIEWLHLPDGMLFLRDAIESYGYSPSIMKELTGLSALPVRLNVGIAGIPSCKINWSKLEWWIGELIRREGTSYLQEQAITAMIAANEKYTFLNEEDYKVLPSIESNIIPEILHHYVAESKFDYFVKAWKQAL